MNDLLGVSVISFRLSTSAVLSTLVVIRHEVLEVRFENITDVVLGTKWEIPSYVYWHHYD